MRRHGNLWKKVTDEENIRLAYALAKRCKTRFRAVLAFEKDRDANLAAIRRSLLEKSFHTGAYHEKFVYEPKKRTIYVLPFAPDRIVQHALIRIVGPLWTKLFIRDSYACIDGRGIHSGSRRTMEFVRRNQYCLKCDVQGFYMSVNHSILMDIIQRKIKCKDTLWLINDIVYSFPGGKNVPIGNLTSQWFGNLYLNELDQFVKSKLKIRDYLRYCDDFCLFHDDKKVLNEAAASIVDFLSVRLKLTLSKCDLFPVSRGVDYLGYRHFRDYILLRKSTAKRVKRRLARLPGQLEQRKLTPETFRSKIASAWGWMRWANCHNLAIHTRLSELMEHARNVTRRENTTA